MVFQNLHQHHDRYFRVHLGHHDASGRYRWRIKSVSDVFNLTTTYGTLDTDRPEYTEMNIDVLPRPVVSMDTSVIYIARNQTGNITVLTRGSPPFSVKIQSPEPEGELLFKKNGDFSINAREEGLYRIIAAEDGKLFYLELEFCGK